MSQQTISALRAWARELLTGALLNSHQEKGQGDQPFIRPESLPVEVDWILGNVLAFNRLEIIREQNFLVPEEKKDTFCELIYRRARGEPLAYILGEAEFCSHIFLVNQHVLIPRPETELLVERALIWLSRRQDAGQGTFRLIDVGTGSGNIVLSILHELRLRFGVDYLSAGKSYALDISEDALSVAKQNAERFALQPYVSFQQSNLLEHFSADEEVEEEVEVEVLVSNPPYIREAEVLPQSVRDFEPALALFAGANGLNVISRLVDQAGPRLRKGAVLLLEIGYGQKADVESLVRSYGFSQVQAYRDFRDVERIIEVKGG